MRIVTNGNGVDTTAQVLALLKNNTSINTQDLYQIGESADPNVLYLTDYDRPLYWGMVGTFIPGVTQRDKIATKIGLEVDSIGFSYSPTNRDFITNSIQGTSPIKLAYEGYYDLKPLKIWRTFMPTDGDANSLGATPYFGGRISSSVTGRDWIKFTANS